MPRNCAKISRGRPLGEPFRPTSRELDAAAARALLATTTTKPPHRFISRIDNIDRAQIRATAEYLKQIGLPPRFITKTRVKSARDDTHARRHEKNHSYTKLDKDSRRDRSSQGTGYQRARRFLRIFSDVTRGRKGSGVFFEAARG